MSGRSPGRVLLVTRNFPPLVGGAERLLWNTFNQLSRQYRCHVIGPEGCDRAVAPPHQAYPCPLTPAPWFLTTALYRALSLATRYRYTLLIAGSGLTAPLISGLAALSPTPTMAFIHGLDLVASGFGYRTIADLALRRCDVVVANSHHTAALARANGILDERIEILHPGVELPPRETNVAEFRRIHGMNGNEKILLFVGRLVPRKGLREFLERCLPAIVRRHPSVLLLVIGETPTMALSTQRENMQAVRTLVSRLGLDSHVRFLGRVTDEALASAYENAHLLVLPIRDTLDDSEGFGMVAVEAASHGTPTIAYRVGGVSDAVGHGLSGLLVDAGDETAMVAAINRALEDPGFPASPASCREFADRFAWANFGDRLLALCQRTACE